MEPMSTNKKRLQEGFTLIEMMVIAPIVILAIGAFLTVIISMTGEVIASRSANAMTYNIQDALNRIEQDVQLSATFLATNNVTLTASEAQGYNDDATNFTNVGGTSGTSLILNMVATTQNPLSSTSEFIFLKDQPNACGDPYDNIPLTYNIVYFVKDNALWRRVIMPSQYANTTSYACASAWQRPSCSPNYMAAQSGTVFCKTSDSKLVEGVASDGFTLEYFTGSNGSSPSTTASNSAASVSARNAALTPVTTLKASIAATQNAGGRDVSHAAEIRVTRLATNASAIASLTPPTTPSAPSVTTRTDPGAKAVFSWAAVRGATGYTIEYNINGGAWQTGFTNQNTRTYTVTAPANEDVVNARVTATNTAGTSGYGTATVTIPLWEPLVLTNGWVKYDTTYGTPAYTKTRDGIVVLKGLMKRTAAAIAYEQFATLPQNYRPSGTLIFANTTYSAANGTNGRIDVQSDGQMLLASGNSTWVSLDTIRFVPPGRYTKTNGALVNSWTNYGGSYTAGGSLITTNGRVFTDGLMVPGTLTNETRIFDLPTASLPAQYHHLPAPSASWAFVGIDYRSTTRGLLAKGIGSSYQSGTANYIASSYSSWTTMTLSSSWVAYGGVFTTPQYTKTSDNLVTLKGMIRNGTITNGTTLLTLPAGYRPKERLLFTAISNRAHARIDVLPTGVVQLQAGGNATWLTFDGISFIGEQ